MSEQEDLIGSDAKIDIQLFTIILMPTMGAFIYSIYRFIRYGWGDLYAIFVIIGSLLSFLGMFGLLRAWSFCCEHPKEKNAFVALCGFSGLLPFYFGIYMLLYMGLFSFRFLLHEISFMNVITPFIWIILGYRLVNGVNLVSDELKKYNIS